jgi:hypothetical protein
VAKQPVLEVTHRIVESEMATTRTRDTTPEPGGDSKDKEKNNADAHKGVVGEAVVNVEEELLKERDGELGLDGVGTVDDLVEGLGDGSPADHDVVACNGGVPVSSAL